MRKRKYGLAWLGIYAALVALHAGVLRLPYYWDEAGYYVPAAYDLLRYGLVIPRHTLSNAHPPLPVVYLVLWWKLTTYAPIVTRLAQLVLAAFAVLQEYRIARLFCTRSVALWSAALFAAYPVMFAQSSLAHADMAALALSLWALRFYYEDRFWWSGFGFSLACMAKETALLTPVVLFAWELLAWWLYSRGAMPHIGKGESREPVLKVRGRPAEIAILLLPIIPLAAWYGFHWMRTGYAFGNPEYFRYNVSSMANATRDLMAFAQRVWHVTGHMYLWMLTLPTAFAMSLPALKDDGVTRCRVPVPVQISMLLIVAAHVVAFSVIGGAVLARYVLFAIPRVIVICVSTLHRRVREWQWLTAVAMLAFIVGWWVNPPYRFAPEDNLSYADFVHLHQAAASYLSAHDAGAVVLTAWPATDELSKPELGYVEHAFEIVRIDNFSAEQVAGAKQSSDYDVALAFSGKLEPPRPLFHFKFWESRNTEYFDYHKDLPPELIAQALGGRLVFKQQKKSLWVAVIETPRTRLASVEPGQSPRLNKDLAEHRLSQLARKRVLH